MNQAIMRFSLTSILALLNFPFLFAQDPCAGVLSILQHNMDSCVLVDTVASCGALNPFPNPATDWSDERGALSLAYVYDSSTFETPYAYGNNTEGSDDAAYITRDGKTMYTFYFPGDFSLFVKDLAYHACRDVAGGGDFGSAGYDTPLDYRPYLVDECHGIDTDNSNPPSDCIGPYSEWLHSDVLFSHRENVCDLFPAVSKTAFSEQCYNDLSPAGYLNANGDTFDILMSTQNPNDYGISELVMYRDVGLNPDATSKESVLFIENGIPLLTDSTDENNPHIEKLESSVVNNDSTYVMLLDNQSAGTLTDIFYSFTTDRGDSWTYPKLLTTARDPNFADFQPHLWIDPSSGDMWIYYSTIRNGISAIVRRQYLGGPDLVADFDSFDTLVEDVVVTIDPIFNQNPVVGIGEPTLTAEGDLVFVVILKADNPENCKDTWQTDVWIMPKKGSAMSNCVPLSHGGMKRRNQLDVEIFPNPAAGLLHYRMTSMQAEIERIVIRDLSGRKLMYASQNSAAGNLDIASLPSGMYFIEFDTGATELNKRFIVE